MLRLLLLATFVFYGSCHDDNGVRYFAGNENGRVVGGINAAKNAWPWQVSLQSRSGNSWTHICGGSLIRVNRVLTAAHCLRNGSYRVVLGEHIRNTNDGTEQYISVSSIRKHSSWNPSSVSSGYDIAILWLSSRATLNYAVKLARLPASGATLAHNYKCFVTGWGNTKTNGPSANTLQQAYLSVVAHSTCRLSSWWGSAVKTTMICAGGDGVHSSCYGDSGGPLNCAVNNVFQVHGIVSFGSDKGCNYYRKPSVFTKVSSYIAWINKNV